MAQPDCTTAPGVAEHLLYHSPERKGYVSIFRKGAKNGRPQTSLWLEKLPSAVEALQGEVDVYVSQAEFTKPNRKLVNLWRLPVAFADLDTYKVQALKGLKPEGLLELLMSTCDAGGIPPPSVVLFSGQGLQVKWLFAEPIGSAVLPRWKALQVELNRRLKGLGADPSALDASRVLRVVGSVNSKTGQLVRVLYTCKTATMGGQLSPDGVAAYDFDMLADSLLPYTRAELALLRDQRDAERMHLLANKQARAAIERAAAQIPIAAAGNKRTGRRFSPSQLAWDRLEDLRALIKMRGFENGLPDGERNKYIFLAAVFLAQSCLAVDLMSELVELASQFAPSWTKADIHRCASSAFSRAEAAAKGGTVEFAGAKVDPRYRFSNLGLVRWLEISPDEARKLRCMLPREETLRRNQERLREARRSDGAMERTEYRARAATRKAEALAMAGAGLSRACIAERLKVTRGAVDGYLRQHHKTTAKSANVSMVVVEPAPLTARPAAEASQRPLRKKEKKERRACGEYSCPSGQKNCEHEAWNQDPGGGEKPSGGGGAGEGLLLLEAAE